ncbi:hypothetical protein BC829DRAFT_396130 [Chytridium lagenaria]|nr:hypothetical protein BC829DRAFT_396130 [Chytridium lagenaria]
MQLLGVSSTTSSPRKADLIASLISTLDKCRTLREKLPTIVIKWGVMPVFDGTKPSYDPASLAVATSLLLDRLLNGLRSPLTAAVIERQHWSFRTATALPILRCAVIEASLFATVRERMRWRTEGSMLTVFETVPPRGVSGDEKGGCDEGEDVIVRGKQKKKRVGDSGRYQRKKKKGVEVVKSLLEGQGEEKKRRVDVPPDLVNEFLKLKKKDDASDAMLLGIAWCEWMTARFEELDSIVTYNE